MTPATAGAIANEIEGAGHGIATIITAIGPDVFVVNVTAPRADQYARADAAIRAMDTLRVEHRHDELNGYSYVCVRIATPGESE
jgi:hypothetical protein